MGALGQYKYLNQMQKLQIVSIPRCNVTSYPNDIFACRTETFIRFHKNINNMGKCSSCQEETTNGMSKFRRWKKEKKSCSYCIIWKTVAQEIRKLSILLYDPVDGSEEVDVLYCSRFHLIWEALDQKFGFAANLSCVWRYSLDCFYS